MTASRALADLLPHRPPMRLVEDILEVIPGRSARARRVTRPTDWFFQGHFPDEPVVPAVVLVELLAQTGGLAACAVVDNDDPDGHLDHVANARGALRVAAFSGFKFPAAAGPSAVLEASARVVARVGGLIRIEGEVTADGTRVAVGSITLAAIFR